MELAAGGDAELGEDLAQVPFDRPRAEEQLGTDLPVTAPVAGEPGDRLPTAREVVESLAINPNTVLKAYRELEHAGLVEGRRGLGTFVRRTLGAAPADSPLRAELAGWTGRASAAGLEREDVAALFTSMLDEHFPKEN